MAIETVEALVEGGKASAAPPLGPALGPLGINISEVVSAINKKTDSFKGMQVPVKIHVDKDTKEFTIEVGTPPAASLIKKEAQVQKGSSNPLQEKVADLLIEQIIKIAKMKEDALLGKDLKQKIKEIVGTCQSMGVLVEGVPAQEALERINKGEFDEEIKSEKIDISEEEKAKLEEERKKLREELDRKRSEFESKAKEILSAMEGKETSQKRGKLAEAGIPQTVIDELVPAEKKEAPKS